MDVGFMVESNLKLEGSVAIDVRWQRPEVQSMVTSLAALM